MNLDADFQRRCEGLHRCAQRAWGRQFLGRRLQLRVAGGTEATGMHDYSSGDELRYVDWNRCARHDELVTRQFMGSEDHTVYFLLDASLSMSLHEGKKFDLARRLTAALSYLALANHDCVWAATFADKLGEVLPAARGRAEIPALFSFLARQAASGSETNLQATVEAFTQRRLSRGLVILLSDMLDAGPFDVAMDALRLRGFEPLLIHIVDQQDAAPAVDGKVTLQDVESGRSSREFITSHDRQYFADSFQQQCRRVRGYFYRYGLGVVPVGTSQSMEHALERIVLGSVARRHTRAGVGS